MVNLIELYKKRYYISHSDLADLAEANRLHLIVACSLLFIFGLGNLIYIFAFPTRRNGTLKLQII